MNIPLELTIRNARQGKLDELKGKKIICHCSAGYRGNIATVQILANGGLSIGAIFGGKTLISLILNGRWS